MSICVIFHQTDIYEEHVRTKCCHKVLGSEKIAEGFSCRSYETSLLDLSDIDEFAKILKSLERLGSK